MPGFHRGRKLDKLGFRSQDTAEIFFENVVLRPIHVIGDPHKGFDYMRGGLAEERLTTSGQSLPWSRRAIELTLDFVTERKAFGQRVVDFQNSKFNLAEMVTELNAAPGFPRSLRAAVQRGPAGPSDRRLAQAQDDGDTGADRR